MGREDPIEFYIYINKVDFFKDLLWVLVFIFGWEDF